jgi:hypothetical protein
MPRRVSSFETAPREQRMQSIHCASTFQQCALQLLLCPSEGVITQWDLVSERAVGEFAVSDDMSFVNSLHAHPAEPFRFAAGSDQVYLFDTRSRGPCLKLETPLLKGMQPVCLHVGFSIRFPYTVTAAFSQESLVVAWDERAPSRQHIIQRLESPSTNAASIDVHLSHPSVLVATAASRKGEVIFFDSGAGAKRKIKLGKQEGSCCVFHPVFPVLAFACGSKLQVITRKVVATTIANDMLSI